MHWYPVLRVVMRWDDTPVSVLILNRQGPRCWVRVGRRRADYNFAYTIREWTTLCRLGNLWSQFFFFFIIRSSQCYQCLLIARADLYFSFLRPSLGTHQCQSFSIQSRHLNSGIIAFLLPSGFHRNTIFTVLSSDIFTRLPAPSSRLTFIVVTIFGFLYITCNSSLVRILQAFGSFIRPCLS